MKEVLSSIFGLNLINKSKLPGYESDNYKIETSKGKFVVKIYSTKIASLRLMQSESEILHYLGVNLPGYFQLPLKTLNGSFYHIDRDKIYKVQSYLEGELFAKQKLNPTLIHSLGSTLGKMHYVLQGYDDISIEAQKTNWDLQYLPSISPLIKFLTDPFIRKIVDYYMLQFEMKVFPKLNSLRKGIIHGDMNGLNILVTGNKVSGIIDFGDLCSSQNINDLAISLTYCLFQSKNYLSDTISMVQGFHKEFQLLEEEMNILYYLIAGRLCQILFYASKGKVEHPDNAEYLSTSEKPASKLIQEWMKINPLYFENEIRKALDFHDF